jgi:hypothetical protein
VIHLSLVNDGGEKILFLFEVEKLTPEEIHIEIETAIQKELEHEKEVA